MKQFTRSVILLVFSAIILLVGFAVANPNQIITAQTGAVDCTQIVPLAAKNLAASCNGLDKDQACFGNSSINVDYMDNATPQPFAKAGDIVPLNILKTITTGPLNTENNQWGLAALKVQSKLPDTTAGQAVTFVMYGDTKISGLASALTGTPSATAAVCSATTNRASTLYTQPSFSAQKGAALKSQTPVNVTGRTNDNAWVQVDNQGTRGWLNPGNLKLSCTLDSVPVVDPTSPGILGGSGAFYFTTGINSLAASCQNVPAGGLLIRSPSGQKVAFRANGAEITIGSTVLFNAQANGAMTLSVLNGQASVLSFGQRQTAGTGQTISVPLGNPPLSDRSDGLEVVGPPSQPQNISGDQSQFDAACAFDKALGGTACTTVRPTATTTQRAFTRTPTPIPATFTPVPAAADTSCSLDALSANPKSLTLGSSPTVCTTISWGVHGVNQVFLNGAGVVGQGSQQFCISKTTTFTLNLVCAGGNKAGSVTVTVK